MSRKMSCRVKLRNRETVLREQFREAFHAAWQWRHQPEAWDREVSETREAQGLCSMSVRHGGPVDLLATGDRMDRAPSQR